MISRLVLSSIASSELASAEISNILVRSRLSNKQHQITGALMLCDGVFLHILEGPRRFVSRLRENLASDVRHSTLEPLAYEEDTDRYFSQWVMAFAHETADGRRKIGGTFDVMSTAGHFKKGARKSGWVYDVFHGSASRIREIQQTTIACKSSSSYG